MRGLALLLVGILLLSGCAPADYERTGYYLGTKITLSSGAYNAQKALDDAMDDIARVDAEMNYSGEGLIRRINDEAGLPVAVTDEIMEILELSIYIHNLSDGAFNPAMLPVMRLWGFDHASQPHRIPDDEEIREALGLCDIQNIEVNYVLNTVTLGEGMALDLGGVAKGWAGDTSAQAVRQNGVDNALLALGGNVVALGTRGGRDYRIGIGHPRKNGEVIATLDIRELAVVTSGDYENYFIEDGVRYHHIIDPRTGYPAASGLNSVTIIAESSALADALSTAVFVLGAEEGLALVMHFDGVDALLIGEDRTVNVTPGLLGRFTLHDEEYTLR